MKIFILYMAYTVDLKVVVIGEGPIIPTHEFPSLSNVSK